MVLLLVRLLLAPAIVLVASLVGDRLGPHRSGLLVGLPSTSLPFLLVVRLAQGEHAAVLAAAGSLAGQVTCACYCVLFARTAPRLRPLAAMAAAVAVAAVAGFGLLSLQPAPALTVLVVVAVAVAGLATWPAATTAVVDRVRRRGDLPLRMLVACLTVAGVSLLVPHLGAALAGAVASLPMILMVMCPAVQSAQGAPAAIGLARGTLGTIPATAAFLAAVVALTPHLGLGPAVVLSLLVLPVVTWGVARLGAAGGAATARWSPVAG